MLRPFAVFSFVTELSSTVRFSLHLTQNISTNFVTASFDSEMSYAKMT
jgi:hypothetical protein